MCPVCPTTSFLGGWVGGFVGVYPPKKMSGRIISAVISATLTTVTLLGIKAHFKLSCRSGPLVRNVAILTSSAFALGVIYSIGVNFLLNRLVYKESNKVSNQCSKEKKCCKGNAPEVVAPPQKKSCCQKK
jgi:hypothetical protein